MFGLEKKLRQQKTELEQMRAETQIAARRAEINQLLTVVGATLYSLNQDQIEIDDIRQAHTACREVRERIGSLKADPSHAGQSGIVQKSEEGKERS